MRRMKKISAQVMVVLLLSAILIDGLPVGWPIHRLVKDRIDPVLDRTGLWQQGWKLFAPEPDRVNVRVSARVQFVDGTEQTWVPLNWSGLDAWGHLRFFRQLEYFDSVRLDRNQAAWDSLAAYVGRNVSHPDQPDIAIEQITLIRSWMEIQDPTTERRQWLESTSYKTGVYEFHTWPPAEPADPEPVL